MGGQYSEGAKFWQQVLTELKNRGVRDIFIGCVDGIKGFPEAMEVVFPMTQVQLCLVHMMRHSLSYVGWKERKAVAADLKPIYRAATEAEAEQALRAFEQKWDRKYPDDQQELAPELAGADPVLQIPGGDPQSDLYDQHAGVGESIAAQDQQEPGRFSPLGIAAQAVLFGLRADCQAVDDADPQLERGAQPLCPRIWRADAEVGLSP